MGATTFSTIASGKTAQAAFQAAVKDAQHEYGHGGYTGTIAEKSGFTEITPTRLTIEAAGELASKLIDADDPRIDDKWGPAGMLRLSDGRFLFFGWASE